MNIGAITRKANEIRRAVMVQFKCKSADISWKLCFNAARKGGNAVTVVNAAMANTDFREKLVRIERKTRTFRLSVNERIIGLFIGDSACAIAKAFINMFPAFKSCSIRVTPVI